MQKMTTLEIETIEELMVLMSKHKITAFEYGEIKLVKEIHDQPQPEEEARSDNQDEDEDDLLYYSSN